MTRHHNGQYREDANYSAFKNAAPLPVLGTSAQPLELEFDRISGQFQSAYSQLITINERLENVANRLVGGVPEPTASDSATTTESIVVSLRLHNLAFGINDQINRMNNVLLRLESL